MPTAVRLVRFFEELGMGGVARVGGKS